MPPDDKRYGVYAAYVTSTDDPDDLGRLKILLPWTADTPDRQEVWARRATLMAGRDYGTWFAPDVGAEALVAFEGGDITQAYVVGLLWSGEQPPPPSRDGYGSYAAKTIIRSQNGVSITLHDRNGTESIELETPGGQKLKLKDGPGSIEVADSNGNSAKFEAAGITITASASVTVNASTIKVSAGLLTVDAGMTKFSGVVQAETVIATSVVSSSYTPGAGNIW